MTFVTCAMKNFPLCKVLDSNFSSQNIISLLPYNLTTFKADIQATHDKAYCIETSLIPTCPICTYPIKEDKYISKSVIETGLYQPTLTSILKLLLSLTQNGVFLDLGANFGYFSIWSACLGFKVVAFEAVTSNVLRIYEAASMSNLKQFDVLRHHMFLKVGLFTGQDKCPTSLVHVYMKSMSSQYSYIFLPLLFEIF